MKKMLSVLLATFIIAQGTYAAVTPSPTLTPAIEGDGHIYRELTEEEIEEGWGYGGDGYIVPPFGPETSTPAPTPAPVDTSILTYDAVPGYVAPARIVLTPEEIAFAESALAKFEANPDYLPTEQEMVYIDGGIGTYYPYMEQTKFDALAARNVAAGIPAEAIWDESTGFGRIDWLGTDIYLGELKSSVFAKVGQPTRIERNTTATQFIYDTTGGHIALAFGQNGRLARVTSTILGASYPRVNGKVGDPIPADAPLVAADTINQDTDIYLSDKLELESAITIGAGFSGSKSGGVWNTLTVRLGAEDIDGNAWTNSSNLQ